jgi:protein involved in polysaccharide export with SLBB domain
MQLITTAIFTAKIIYTLLHYNFESMKRVIWCIFLLLSYMAAFSQDLNQQDLSKIDIDAISDKDILYYYNRLQEAGIPFEQAAQVAQAKGMPASEIAKLRERIDLLLSGGPSDLPGKNTKKIGNTGLDSSLNKLESETQRKTEISLTPFTDELVDNRVFGSEFFRSSSLSFEPNLRIATPANYVLGPDDELNIDVYGYSEENYKLKVNPEGSIYIPNAGPVFVSGLTVDEAANRIRSKLSATIYKAIATGATRVQVSLGNIRSIRVTIIGQAKKPGSYTISSLSTVFNALYLCGGPNFKGSFRNIELIRNNKVLRVVDLYNFLLRGSLSDNVRLMDQDVIRIPYYTSRISIDGEIKRPGIFEIQPGDNLQQALNYAGGFSDSAFKSSITVYRVGEIEKEINTVSEKGFSSYILQSGDGVQIKKILNRFSNRVEIIGAVKRPGEYELSKGMTLKQLIGRAEGLREDAFRKRGTISRLKDDFTPVAISFDVDGILNGTHPDITLVREDSVSIVSLFDLRNEYEVNIIGEVRKQGTYGYKDSITVKDLIFRAGGFTEFGTSKRVEIARRVTDANIESGSTEIAKIIEINTEKDLNLEAADYYLQPFDMVLIRSNPGYVSQKVVYVTGEVMFPGPYVLNTVDEKLSSIVKRAGGVRPTANAAAASLKRNNRLDDQAQLKLYSVSKLANIYEDTVAIGAVDTLKKEALRPYDLIGIDLEAIMQNPGRTNDMILEDGDLVFVPKRNQAVKVRGEILFPTQFAFEEGHKMKYYIDKAGGFTNRAVRRKAFVLGSNGSAKKVKGFFLFKSYPKINAGDEIYVPEAQPKPNQLSTAEAIGITSSVAALISVIIALFNSL